MVFSKNRTTYILYCVFLSLITFYTSNINAGIYKWVDAQGNIHYGAQRPTNTDSKKLSIQHHAPEKSSSYDRPGAKKPKTAEGDAEVKTGADKKTSKDTPDYKAESKADKKRRLAACSQARKSMSKMATQGRVRTRDKEGNVNYMSDKQKQSRIKRAKELITKHCS